MSECRECGRPLVLIYEQTWTSPAEYECAVCDGGVDPKKFDNPYPADAFDEDYERARASGWED